MTRPIKPRGRRPARVALIVETSIAPGRDMLRGIAQYEQEHGPWVIFHEPRGLDEQVPALLHKWKGDGVISRIQNPHIARAVKAMKIPAVDVLGAMRNTGIPLVHVDDAAIAKLAADHLLERGFERFAFYGIESATWSANRCHAFVQHVRKAGYACDIFNIKQHPRTSAAWEKEQVRLSHWLKRLPKPVGVMVCTDHRAQRVIEACRHSGIAVPDEIAVIGVDNDEPLCLVCAPPLSSVVPNHQRVGYEAAALLDRLMSGEDKPALPSLIQPTGIVVRQSSDVMAVEDARVASAMRFIREHACERLAVPKVAAHVGLSRNMLQRLFQRTLRRTIHDEIVNARLRRAQQLLSQTEMPLDAIAHKTGFKHQEYMGVVFRSRLKTTPGQYRKMSGL